MSDRKVANMLSSRAASPILKSLMTWPRCDSHSPLCAQALICVWSFDPEQSKQQERCRGGGDLAEELSPCYVNPVAPERERERQVRR